MNRFTGKMRLDVGKPAAIILFISLFLPMVKAAGQSQAYRPATDSMSLWQARRAVAEGILASSSYSVSSFFPSSFRFDLDTFEFDASVRNNREHFKIDLRTLKPVVAKRLRQRLGHAYFVKDEAGGDLAAPLNQLSWGSAASAESLAGALNRLRAITADTVSPHRSFPQQAAAWRALTTKPPLPEEVRVQRLLAENAVKEQKLKEALNSYEIGLELYPTWPQGYFNAALIAAELNLYGDAIEHMQSYLELAPDAPDAQAARDQIVIWQHKAKQ